jgi:hypothetical protein
MFKKIIIGSVLLLAACARPYHLERPARAEYHAVCAETRRALTHQVELFMNLQGRWRPQGGVTATLLEGGAIQYCQALILLKED